MHFSCRVVTVGLAAQKLVERRHDCKEALEDYSIATYDKLDEVERMKSKIVCKNLSGIEPLKPMGYFALNKSTLLSIFGTVITYCIILMQFKQANF